jgi:hypothetical protein
MNAKHTGEANYIGDAALLRAHGPEPTSRHNCGAACGCAVKAPTSDSLLDARLRFFVDSTPDAGTDREQQGHISGPKWQNKRLSFLLFGCGNNETIVCCFGCGSQKTHAPGCAIHAPQQLVTQSARASARGALKTCLAKYSHPFTYTNCLCTNLPSVGCSQHTCSASTHQLPSAGRAQCLCVISVATPAYSCHAAKSELLLSWKSRSMGARIA